VVDYAKKSVLVTGATGFIGGRLAERLAFEQRADLRLLIRDWRHAVWASRLPVRLIEGDVTQSDSLVEAFRGCEVVFHCVGVGGDPELCRRVNVEGTLNILRAAHSAGVQRVVYLSSIAVHGPNPPDNAKETAPLVRTGSPYGDSKVEAEETITRFTREYPLPVVIVRPTFVWGPRSTSFTIEPVRQIMAGTWQLVDEGRGTCHAVYVDNLTDALLAAGSIPGIEGEAFLITDEQPCTWAEFFQHYSQMIGGNTVGSFPSKWLERHPVRRLDRKLDRIHAALYDRMPGLEPLRFSCRATCYLIRKYRKRVDVKTIFGDWDLIKYARVGRLDTRKARACLRYIPRITREEGMRLTEHWLRDQCILPPSPPAASTVAEPLSLPPAHQLNGKRVRE
jgi:nucleoside-diphosphate-sugar epimerase